MVAFNNIALASLAAVGSLAAPAKRDQCMSSDQANQVAELYGELIATYTDELANAILTPNFTDYSESVNTLINTCPQGDAAVTLPLLAATFSSRQQFEIGQGQQPQINFKQLGLWNACNSVIIRWETTNTANITSPKPVIGLIVMDTVQAPAGSQYPFLIDTVYSEFDAGAWLQNLQEQGICPKTDCGTAPAPGSPSPSPSAPAPGNPSPAPGNPAPGNPAPSPNPAPGNPAPGNPAPGNPAPGYPHSESWSASWSASTPATWTSSAVLPPPTTTSWGWGNHSTSCTESTSTKPTTWSHSTTPSTTWSHSTTPTTWSTSTSCTESSTTPTTWSHSTTPTTWSHSTTPTTSSWSTSWSSSSSSSWSHSSSSSSWSWSTSSTPTTWSTSSSWTSSTPTTSAWTTSTESKSSSWATPSTYASPPSYSGSW